VTLAHTPGSTAPAYDVVLTDRGLAGLLVVVPGSVAVAGVAGATVSNANGGFTITIPAMQLNETVTVTYLVTIQGSQGDGTLPNTARFVADSSPGTPIGGDPANPGASQVVINGEATATITAIAGQPPVGPPLTGSFNDPGADALRLANYFRAPGIEPAYAGAADPGSALTISLRDANGSTVNSITRMVDGGGSWVALFSASRGYPGDLPRVSEYLSGTQLFRDIGDTLIPDFSDRDIRLQDDLNQQPFTASINVTSSGAGPFAALPQNTRLYFADTLNPGLYANDNLNIARAVGGAAGHAVAAGLAAAASPLSFAYNRFAGEFLGGGAAPHGGY
jgi:large repetitive protein